MTLSDQVRQRMSPSTPVKGYCLGWVFPGFLVLFSKHEKVLRDCKVATKALFTSKAIVKIRHPGNTGFGYPFWGMSWLPEV